MTKDADTMEADEEDLPELKGGFDLDVEVAEALGMEVRWRSRWPKETRGIPWMREINPELRYSHHFQKVPRWSTDMGDAWYLVRRMEALGFHVRVTSPFEPGQPSFAGFTRQGTSGWNGRPDYSASDDNAATAVALAALLALEAHNA